MVRTGISVFCRCQSIAHSLTLAHTLTHALTQIQWIHCELVLCVRASVRLLLLLSQCIGIWPWRINMCVLARLVRNSFVVRALTLLQFGVSFTLGSEPISVSVFILLLIWFAHWFFFVFFALLFGRSFGSVLDIRRESQCLMRAHTDYSYTKTIWLFDFSIALRAWWSHTSDSIHSYGFGSIQFLSFARAMAHRVWVWQCTVYSTCVHTNIQHCAGVYSPNANVGVPTKCWCQPILRSGCVYDIVVDIQMLLCICAHDLWVCYRASLIRSNHIQKEEWEKKSTAVTIFLNPSVTILSLFLLCRCIFFLHTRWTN